MPKTEATERKKLVTLADGRISIISNILEEESYDGHTARLSANMTLLVLEGEGSVWLNNRKQNLQKNDLLVCPEGSVIEREAVNEEIRVEGFYLSNEFFNDLLAIPMKSWDAKAYIIEHPVIHLTEEQTQLWRQYYELIRSKLETENPGRHHPTVTNLLIQAFMYEFHDTIAATSPLPPPRFTASEYIYNQFMNLVTSLVPKPRKVTWYANSLNVSPKHLCEVCKEVSGETPFNIINKYVREDVIGLLQRPDRSIKEVAHELGFPSISFFGKYVKKQFGMPPKQFRQSLT